MHFIVNSVRPVKNNNYCFQLKLCKNLLPIIIQMNTFIMVILTMYFENNNILIVNNNVKYVNILYYAYKFDNILFFQIIF